MANILIVEDDKAISNLIYINLMDEGYKCTCAYDGKQAADLIESNSYDLILLDIMLPEISGYELMEYIKPMKTAVIFLTAKSDVDDRVLGLKKGADDYIVKPFQIKELLARVEAVLRRYQTEENEISVLDITILLDSRTVLQNGKEVDLTIKEFDLLVYLAKNKNVALYRGDLYDQIWGGDYVGETRTLDTHIQRLRKKLNWEEYIRTVFRIGYKLEVRF